MSCLEHGTTNYIPLVNVEIETVMVAAGAPRSGKVPAQATDRTSVVSPSPYAASNSSE
jgi:hypothetical protein